MNGPLSGIKVVELATYVAAPVVGRMLADLGAEVIKVEAPAGDNWRNTGVSYLPRFTYDENPVFDIYNTGKKHISLNLKAPEGMDAMHRLLGEADVFLTNTRPQSLKKLGLDYDTLKEKYPRLIYAIILGYGAKGPDKDKPAFDTTAFWSRGGFLRDMGPLNEHYTPVSQPSSVGDTATGYLLLAEISTALFNRTRTGKGDYVRSTLYHNGIFCFGTMAIITQKPFGRKYPASRVDLGAPAGSYECADGEWVYFTLANAAVHTPKVCKMIGRPELMEEEFFQPANRWKNRQKIYDIFKAAFLTKPSTYWLTEAEKEDITFVRMAHFSDISEDPQAWENGYVEHVTFRNGNTDVMPASPIEMESCTPPKTVPAPPNGTHTAEILAQLGYSPEQIEAMLASGAAVAAKEEAK